MTTLLNQLPSELLNIIEIYKKPLECDHCKKISFEILFCIRNDNHKICHDCINKCLLCDAFVYDTGKIEEYSGCNDSHGCFVGSSKCIKMENKKQNYCPGHECMLCKKMICYKCFLISDDYCGRYYCRQCIHQCGMCDKVFSDFFCEFDCGFNYYSCSSCDEFIIRYKRTKNKKYFRRL